MYLKRFKYFIKEDVSQNEFDNFVEKVMTTNKISSEKAYYFVDFSKNEDLIYKVIFFDKSEILVFKNEDDNTLNLESIKDYIEKTFTSESRYVFANKTLKGVVNAIEFPGLFKLNENKFGIIYSLKKEYCIDLMKYKGNIPEIKKRISETKVVLCNERKELSVDDIAAFYIWENGEPQLIEDVENKLFNDDESNEKEGVQTDEI